MSGNWSQNGSSLYKLKKFGNIEKFNILTVRVNGDFEDIASIQELANEWNAGWDNQDTEALLALFADEPVLMPQGQQAINGKEAIRSLYQSLFQNYTVKGVGQVMEIEVSGDMGYFWSNYHLTAFPKDGSSEIHSDGKSLFVVRRQKYNTWKIARLMDNSNAE